nr:spore coat associated protein CotJA [uncultured Schaedlerella sp.]
MANYQNNMRYGRQGNMRPMRPMPGMHTGCQPSSPQMDARCCDPAPKRDVMHREDCGCRTPEADRIRREDCGCRTPEADRIRREDCGCCTPPPEPRKAPECRERKMPKNCECMMDDPLYDMPIAMAYVPWQTWCGIRDICEGFRCGTVFEELDQPFLGRGGWKR